MAAQCSTEDDADGVASERTARAGRLRLRRLEDGALVQLAQRGSADAWDELVRRLSGLVQAVARRYRLCPADAADVAQVTWLQLHRHIGALRRPERVLSWVATTARNECLRIVTRRREELTDPVTIDADPDHGGPDPLESVLTNERATAVHEVVHQIPMRSQQLLQLLLWEGRSYRDVSDALEMPVGSIGPTRERVLKVVARHPAIMALDDSTRRSPDGDLAAAG
jgi:RNA polymerase sigma factor (sigma-70 family)